MKKLILFLFFISNCFSAEVKDAGERKFDYESKSQKELKLPKTQNEKVLLDTIKSFLIAKNPEELNRVNILLDIGTNPDVQDENGVTPLMWAVRAGDLDLIKKLRNKGANVTISDIQGGNALIDALILGDIEILQEILKFKDIQKIINNQDIFGNTVLHLAVGQNNEEIIISLLKVGANPFIKNKKGKTAKDLAKEKRFEDMFNLLEKYEKLYNQNGKELAEAAKKGNLEKVAIILKDGFVDINHKLGGIGGAGYGQQSGGATPLILAAVSDNVNSKEYYEIVNMLINSGADINAQQDYGRWTALMWAADRGDESIVKLLLASGAHINTQDADGKTALIWAVYKNRENIIKLLIAAGANINIKDVHGENALMYAARTDEKALKLLIDSKADINIKNNEYGRTALMLAIRSKNNENAKLLINAGANINLEDKYGNRAKDYAIDHNMPEIANIISQKEEEFREKQKELRQKEFNKYLEALIQKGKETSLLD